MILLLFEKLLNELKNKVLFLIRSSSMYNFIRISARMLRTFIISRDFSIFDTRTCGTITLDTIVIIREIVLFTSKNDKQINTNQWDTVYKQNEQLVQKQKKTNSVLFTADSIREYIYIFCSHSGVKARSQSEKN